MNVLVMVGRETVYSDRAHMVVMPGRDGEFSALDFHQPFLYRLRRGIVKIITKDEGRRTSEENEESFHIKDGLARFNENNLLILCEME